EGRSVVKFRVRSVEPTMGLFAIVPYILAGRDYAGQPLGALALGNRQANAPLEGGFGNNLNEKLASGSSLHEDPPGSAAQRFLGKPFLYGVGQIAECFCLNSEHFSHAGGIDHIAHYSRIPVS